MIYQPINDDILCICVYGSRLYGTSTPTSDHDFKVIYLPTLQDVFLGKKLKVNRFKFDQDGKQLNDDKAMPDNGYEAEHIPVQKFVNEYLSGQAYAVELVFAVMCDAHKDHMPPYGTDNYKKFYAFTELCAKLGTEFVHANVNGMTGFAKKQVFDYVKRGERLNAANNVYWCIRDIDALLRHIDSPRLDTSLNGKTVLDLIAESTELKITHIQNNNKIMRALELNGRTYSETTDLMHFKTAVQKLINEYGDRSTNAAKTSVDYKSLSHAVRVYEQVLELLYHRHISFPRRNAAELLQIKNGNIDVEEVKIILSKLDDEVNIAIQNTLLPQVDAAFIARVDEMLFLWLKELY